MPRRFSLPRLCAFSASIVLSGCGHVPVTSLLAMSRINFETTDIAAMRAALRIPTAYQARENRMIVEITQEGKPPHRSEFALERVTSASELSLIGSEKRAGTELVVYKLPDPMVAKFEEMRTEARKAKEEKRKGSLTIKLEPDFCYVAEPPKGSLVFSTYLRTSETRSYVAVLQDLDGFSQPEFAEKIRVMPKC
ncbi:MAG: hypothetical protein CFE31_09715 [Rhizobiales bacterium PAR1]|nr:MAG: hypothetical protein CFE31_09715 [Rhizobiales bacterium PAR1]